MYLRVVSAQREVLWTKSVPGEQGELIDDDLNQAITAAMAGEKDRFFFACADEPEPSHWEYNQCALLSERGRQRQAILIKACQTVEEPWRSLSMAGIYHKSRLFGKTIEMLEQALAHQDLPNRAEVTSALKRLYEDVGNIPAAKALAL